MNPSLVQLISAAFAGQPPEPLPSSPRRGRRKLWQLPHSWHCPIVGTCLPLADMRRLARRAGLDDGEMSDYTLHTAVVGNCEARTSLAEDVHRTLEKRYAPAIARFAKAKGEAAVLDLWRQALASGNDIAGALWAAWTHPDMGDEGGKAIYGDIHMLSHQVGASVRAELGELERLREENRRLLADLRDVQERQEDDKRRRDRTLDELRRQLADAEARAARLARRESELAAAKQEARDYQSLFDRSQALARRVETLEERNGGNARRVIALEAELADALAGLQAMELALESALDVCEGVSGVGGCGRTCPAEARLAGRCVLCIGGRANLVEGYRRLVETRGGRFVHHDGGEEHNIHRIDAAVSGADVVVCQSGCVSHAAYWRLKEACKKLGKPCVFVKSPGVGSFARSLAALDGDAAQVGRLLAN